MSVIGVGLDLVDVDAFAAQLSDEASAFSAGTFTGRERQAAGGGDAVRHLAARFAAKEAFVKAWASSRFGRAPALASIDMREIEVVNDAFGRPSLFHLHGSVAGAIGGVCAHLSLTHDGPVAGAVVVLEDTRGGDS